MSNNRSSEHFNHVSIETEIIWSAALVVVDFLIIVLNLATILTFIINRHLRRRNMYCLINLAVADMMYGAASTALQIFHITYNIRQNYYNILSRSFDFITNITLFTSFFSLVVVSLERVYATFLPFRHRTTQLRMYIFVFNITWLLSLCLMIPFFTRSSNSTYFIFTLIKILFGLIIICASYTAIFVKVKIQAKRLLIQPNQQQRAVIQMRQKREQHLAMTLFIVTVLSLITWLPFIIDRSGVIQHAYTSNNASYHVNRLVLLIQETNSLINPIIYVLRMKHFRKALSKLLFKCSRDRQYTNPVVRHGNHGNHGRQHQPPIELQVL